MFVRKAFYGLVALLGVAFFYALLFLVMAWNLLWNICLSSFGFSSEKKRSRKENNDRPSEYDYPYWM